MKVLFRTKWFGPDSFRRRANTVYNLPDEWKSLMPKSAIFLDDEEEVKEGPMTAPAIAKVVAKKAAKPAPAAKVEVKI